MTSAIRYERDADGIVVLTLDDPTASANTMNELYGESMEAAVAQLEAEEGLAGVVITSAKKTFFAGGNLTQLQAIGPDQADEVFAKSEGIKAQLRRIEKLGVPTVAAINGAALGGGLEIALAFRHRIAVDGRYEIGLPEVTLGLLPGGGGVTRVTRMLGVQSALMDVLVQGQRMKPAAAQAKGLVDELVGSVEELLPAAKAWIAANADNDDAKIQPWDAKGYKMPGGTPSHPALAGMLPAFPASLAKQLKGVRLPAPEAIMSAVVEGAQVDFETASRIESRYFASLVTGQTAKNMIQAFFFDLQAINSGSLRPQGIDVWKPTKVVVLGAGMMGAGIAYVCARAGLEVVLKDVSVESAERGKAYSAKINEKAVSRGKLTQEKSDELLARITPTDNPADAKGCDLVIEAVFEDPSLKHKVFAEIAEHINPDALLCSNTSTLPITELATGVDRPADFIGLHFFSPVDKMPLVEIIRGAETSDEATAKAIDVVQLIRKTPIVVNDSRGFYTSRVIGTQINEGLAMLGEGVAPMSIERATMQAGYPVGPLQITDELNMELMVKIRNAGKAAAEAEGVEFVDHPAFAVVDKMIEAGRSSKLKGAGFYSYDESGKRTGLWEGLAEVFPAAEEQIPFADIADRQLVVEAIETVKCFDEGVLMSAAEANIGGIFGIGFPPATGGPIQYINGFEGETGRGPAGFVARARQLAERYGERFTPPASLVAVAESGATFPTK
ncbi:3-hydroxyacyl-CoA dehydrogenase NAD-binding domain-containing protein [Nocardioides limicola]|uniref:3-hydroxyacyl-CoA dehydrogenase NAD-binding domain-containing protein n=1 Tax=Nocardioides limicola TaxID=2803368 RepID=UPI00193C5913|nr:3-hydroxyacyl-CoA dehydrogenase NAD-binding domain-containing protein [Nocardioides sp. DJM-14]